MRKVEIVQGLSSNKSEGIFCTATELYMEGQRSKGLSLHLRRRSAVNRSGIKRSSIRGRGMEFFESRPYVPQDEMRSIDWKVSARLNEMFTKVFIEERDRPIYIALDLRSPMIFGSINCFKSVLAARIAARLAVAAINGGDLVGGLLWSDVKEFHCALRRGPKAIAHFLGLVARGTRESFLDFSTNSQSSSWVVVLKQIINRVHPGTVVFFISDFHGLLQEHHALLYKLRKKADVFALMVNDPVEKSLPQAGLLGLCFDDERLIFNSDDRGLREGYADRQQQYFATISSIFSSLNIPKVDFSTAQDPTLGLKRIFSGGW